MNWFQNLTIRSKVISAFATVLVVTAALGVFAINRLSAVNENVQAIATNYLVGIDGLGDFSYGAMRYRQLQASQMIASSLDAKAAEEKKLGVALDEATKGWDKYNATVEAGYERNLADKMHAAWNDYVALNEKLVQLSNTSKNEQATDLYTGDLRTAFNKFQDLLTEDKNFQRKSTDTEVKDATDTYSSSRTLIMVVLGLATTLCLVTGWMIVNGVSVPIRGMTAAMTRLAQHDLTTEVVGAERKDEVGQMANAVLVFKNSMIEGDRLKEEQEIAQRNAAVRSAKVDSLTRDFDQRVQGVVQTVASQATQMQASAQSMSASAEESTKQAGAVAAASEESAANVQTVASAAEELSSSIAEIGRQVSHSSQIATTAVTEAAKANEMVQGLLNASQKIGEIVALINEIADQTNLLALNATIEAARAGEAGKGFAVVAAEVKNLATQTSKATEEIGAQITSVQGATQNAVNAIGSIGKTISEIDQISAAIAAAVEQQGAATQEIARNVEEAAKGTQEVSSNIGGVTEAANSTGAVANQVLASARSLTEQSGELRALVQTFLTEVKAA
ncbi:MAG TPA: methyl-accepting chemotaxis protein [Rhizomicrobium sp.]|nr:methyl-accepting chemotaxis protein [Rhizomicrobium sp.]